MNKLLLASLSIAMAAMTASSAFADECINPSSIIIDQSHNGTFEVRVPAGYTLISDSGFLKNGTISFLQAALHDFDEELYALDPSNPQVPSSPRGPYSIKATSDAICSYGIDEAPDGSFKGGFFYLSKNGTANSHYNLGKNWMYNLPGPTQYYCTASSTECSFSLSGYSSSEIHRNPWGV